jgi:hypothetical protein
MLELKHLGGSSGQLNWLETEALSAIQACSYCPLFLTSLFFTPTTTAHLLCSRQLNRVSKQLKNSSAI